MWNSKRLLLLVASFFLFLTGYGFYATCLGGIDGLPPLPPEFWPEAPDVADLDPPPRPESMVNQKLAQAFGEHSDVLNLAIKLEAPARRMALATDEFKIAEGGRVELRPFRIALFGKTVGENGTPEINTIGCDVAYLTLDQPVSSMAEMGGRKITAAELRGNVKLVNNRRTPSADDDLSLLTQGPVYYQGDRHYIWTNQVVRLTDLQNRPKPTTITATGMDVYLTAESTPPPPSAANARKAKLDNVSGVDRVCLRADVEMHLYVDSRSGFLGDGKKAKAPPAVADAGHPPGKGPAAAEPGKAHVKIFTEGPFAYDVVKDHARFDVSPVPSRFPKHVEVVREQAEGRNDVLECEHLELQFRRKNGKTGPAPAANDGAVDMDIESAHATGDDVTLTSDAEKLEAHCSDLFYDARTKTSILRSEKGPADSPQTPKLLRAVKEGHVIYARELRLAEAEGTRQASALGPDGKIFMYDPKTGSFPLHAEWNDTLVSGKEGGFDCLTLTGNAIFMDEEHEQYLRGDSLKIWLRPAGDAGDKSASPEQRAKPHHLVARGHVRADSPDMHIQDPTEQLVIWFKDPPPVEGTTVAPIAVKGPPAAPAEGKQADPKPAASAAARTGPLVGTLTSAPNGRPADAAAPRKPINLSAHWVEAYVVRGEAKNDLERLWCKGTVRVLQDGATPEDRGVDIRGETLDLNHFPEGNVLLVTGNLGLVQMNKTSIIGPEINIDQRSNVAKVNGLGVMKMPATSDFNGKPLARPVEMVILWKESMLFDGKCAGFHGDVQAKQENSRLLCQQMQVYMDHAVSFREGEKGSQPAKVDRLICDGKVLIEERVFQAAKLESYRRLAAPVLALDNADGKANAPGPGMVHILQRGTDDAGAPGPAAGGRPKPPAKGPPNADPLKLTRVAFRDRLFGNNAQRTVVFFGDVRVLHLPTDDPDVKVDLDHLPEGCMYLTCEQLRVFSDASKSQQMEARGRVTVQGKDFYALADVLKYNEDKEQVILEGSEGSPAKLLRYTKGPTYEPDKFTGQKIFFWRRTNDVRIENGQGISTP